MRLKYYILFTFLIWGICAGSQTAKASKYQDSLSLLIKTAVENPTQTIAQSDSLLAEAKQRKDSKKYASLLLAKGTTLSFLGKNTEALTHQMLAYKLFDSLNNPTGKAVSLINIAFSQVHLQNYKKAKEYLLQTLAITDKNNSKLLTTIYANLGISCTELGEYQESIEYFELSLPHYKKTGNSNSLALVYHGIAIAHEKLNNSQLAETYSLLSLGYQKKDNSDYTLCVISLSLSELYLNQGRLEEAKTYLDLGGAAAQRINSPYHLEKYHNILAQWHKAKGHYKMALEHYEKYMVLKDSVYSLEITKSNIEIEERFQNELKSNEIQLLKTQKELTLAEAKKNKFLALILILTTVLSLAIIVVLYQNYKGNKKTNELLKLEKLQLAEKNRLLESENILVQFETLRNQVSPHFLFNALSALTSLIKTDTEKALKFTKEFSKIFRSTLELKEKSLITLKEELGHVNSYLYLQKMRFDSNLIINTNIDSKHLNDYLPPFSLQMVIENAIKHNTITAESPLKISVSATDSFLVVVNNLQIRSVNEDSTKTGVKNITSRYKYISKLEPTFEIKNNLFYVKLPLIKEDL